MTVPYHRMPLTHLPYLHLYRYLYHHLNDSSSVRTRNVLCLPGFYTILRYFIRAISHHPSQHTHTHTHCQYRLPDESKEGRDILNEMPTEAERSSVVEIIPKGLGRYVTHSLTHSVQQYILYTANIIFMVLELLSHILFLFQCSIHLTLLTYFWHFTWMNFFCLSFLNLLLPQSHSLFLLLINPSNTFHHQIFVTGNAYCVRLWATYTLNYSHQSAPELSKTSR